MRGFHVRARRHRALRRWATGLGAMLAVSMLTAQSPDSPADPTPATIDEFRSAVARILNETGVPGAGISLVRADGVEWEGGVGVADRARQTPVTADTHFRVGSISKTFVAMALVQLSEDGLIDLDGPVHEIAPEVAIDNPWGDTDPVRVIHLLQHTAGFDDMHFNEMYATGPDLTLLEVLQRNPASRRVRWRPGTRMAYSNPGYAVAGYLIEKITGLSYSDYIRNEIFLPLSMETSSFELTGEDESALATGYEGPDSPPAGYPAIYLRPAGNMHGSASEMGRFVRMLLNWGELDHAFVIDPEYLGTMERPQSTLAARAGLLNGYGSGIATLLHLPYRVLGHGGSIEGFFAGFGYSPSRDVGYVFLLNSGGAPGAQAFDRLNSLSIRFLKRDVEPPPKPEATVASPVLDTYVGYYHDANPRNQILWGVQWLLAGHRIFREGDALVSSPIVGARSRLVPVSETLFRRAGDLDASRVFTTNEDGVMVLAGTDVYAERRSRWDVERVRVPVLLSVAVLLSAAVAGIVWIVRVGRAEPRGFWPFKIVLILCPVALLAPAAGLALTPRTGWGEQNAGTLAFFLGTLALPALGAMAIPLAVAAWREGASRLLVSYGLAVATAAVVVSVYLRASGLMGTRLWMY